MAGEDRGGAAMSLLKIAGGRVVDPSNGLDDAVGDVWIQGGRVIAAPGDPSVRPDRTIDARGYVVMPGGVDVHCHIAGSKVNAARMMRPEEAREGGALRRGPRTRSGTLGSVPSTFATGYKYAGLGYTTAVDAAIPPLGARHAHHELRDTPIIDKAFLTLMGNNHYVMDRIREGAFDRLKDYMAWLLRATKAYGVKIVNPGGVEQWKAGDGRLATLDETVDGFGVTPRQILVELARAADELALPHPIHMHGLHLGLPGNAATTLDTMRALDGHRAHFAHIQFHSYGGSATELDKFDSQVPMLADYVNTHQNITVDVGQVIFGETTSMTADGAVGQYLAKLTGRKWISHDVELETGCGVVPITYKDENLIHALQWAIGLEWYLRVEDPWKIAMSTDHPNGGSFLAYPRIIALLMSKNLRDETLARLPEGVRSRSGLGEITREYTLSEIAILTRSGPARMLGMRNKGHLGAGADGDVTIYAPDDDKTRMFAIPRYVVKGGRIILDDGDLREVTDGETMWIAPEFDQESVKAVEEWFESDSSINFRNFGVDETDVAD
jgi:formylmethanofuran dehydrogenase subunit A